MMMMRIWSQTFGDGDVDDGVDGGDDDDSDDDGKEAKTTPGSDLYWPALPGATGGIKASKSSTAQLRIPTAV